MFKRRTKQVLLPSIAEGTATRHEGASNELYSLVNQTEMRMEIDDESKKLQQMREEAKEINRAVETNIKMLEASIENFKEVKVAFDAATGSADTIVDCIIAAIIRAENADIMVDLSDNAKKALAEQREAHIQEEQRILSEHRQKLLKIANSCGGFFLTGWMAKLAVWSWGASTSTSASR